MIPPKKVDRVVVSVEEIVLQGRREFVHSERNFVSFPCLSFNKWVRSFSREREELRFHTLKAAFGISSANITVFFLLLLLGHVSLNHWRGGYIFLFFQIFVIINISSFLIFDRIDGISLDS